MNPQITQITQPAGLQESSRWSESAETTGPDDETNRTPKGCQNFDVKIFYVDL